MGACIFCEIASGRTETRVIFDDGDVLAFPDVHPQAPLHLLLIPRIHIPNTLALAPLHDQLVGKLVRIAAQLATDKAVAADGYRLLTNTRLASPSITCTFTFSRVGPSDGLQVEPRPCGGGQQRAGTPDRPTAVAGGPSRAKRHATYCFLNAFLRRR